MRTLLDVKKLLGSLYEEHDYEVQEAWVEGTIPADLHGTYFRNGPGLQVSNSKYFRHAFDGDGLIASFAFKDGRCHFRNAFVRTEGFVAEQAAGRPLLRGAFTRGAADGSPLFNPFDLSMKNVANTGVLHWGGRLLALFENGLPHEMDPSTLETLGETRLGGQIDTKALGAHYRILRDPDGSRRLVSFAVEPGPQFKITFFEFDESGTLLHRQPHVLAGASVTMLHDFAVTPHWYVVVEGPIRFDLKKFLTRYLFSRCSVAGCLVFDPTGKTRVHLIPRGGASAAEASSPRTAPRTARVYEAEPFFSFHCANAFELPCGGARAQSSPAAGDDGPSEAAAALGSEAAAEEEGKEPLLVVDLVAWDSVDFERMTYDVLELTEADADGPQPRGPGKQPVLDPSIYEGGARPHLVRVSVDPSAPDGAPASAARLLRRTAEFPSVNPDWTGRPHTHIYCGADAVDDDVFWAPLQCVCRVTLPEGTAEEAREGAAAQLDTWYAGPRCFVMEPLFVPRGRTTQEPPAVAVTASPRSSEDDGWVLATVYDAEAGRGSLCIFNARAIARGPVARIRLPHHLPSSLHGSWTDECFGPTVAAGAGAGAGAGSGRAAGAAPAAGPFVVNRIRPL